MAHKVKFSLPERELGNKDAIFSIYQDGEKVGTLTISKGAIEWASKNWKWRKGYKVRKSWRSFDELMSPEYKGRVGKSR